MIGTSLSNNCYHWNSNPENLTCNMFVSHETMLWYKRLGHVSMSKICKTLKVEAIQGVLFQILLSNSNGK